MANRDFLKRSVYAQIANRRHADKFNDKRTKRNRTRSSQKRNVIKEHCS